MHITNKALISILICVVVILGAYKYYDTKYKAMRLEKKQASLVQTPHTVASSTLTLAVGDSVSVDGLTFTLTAIIEDVRCPIDVQCKDSKGAIASITVQQGANIKTETIQEQKEGITVFGKTILLTRVLPERLLDQKIETKEYRLTFLIK